MEGKNKKAGSDGKGEDWEKRDPSLKSRKETGKSKIRVAVLFGYVGTGYHGLQWDVDSRPSK
jgi:hypothetical protein